MSLARLLREPGTTLAALAAHLDAADHATRVAETRELGHAAQKRLYELGADAPPLDVAYFVPPDRAPRQEVRHHGRNTLPVPRAFRFFEKRMCRPDQGDAVGRAFGYNQGVTVKLLGPGYFVLRPTAGHAEWEPRGAIVVDYFQVPDGAVAEGWPKVVPNSVGLQTLVYNGTRDFMRGVSRHVSIGAAFKGERSLGHYFVLARED